jgi:CRISPR-associated protein Cmr4
MSSTLFDAKLYTIKALTNLHVGNGEVNYSVLDKQVQRDVITTLPQINASSLKGALREFTMYSLLEQCDNRGEKANSVCKTVFGSSPTETEELPKEEKQNKIETEETLEKGKQKPKTPKTKAGYLNFFDAKLLALPIRTESEPFFMATSKEVLKTYLELCECFDVPLQVDNIDNLEEGYYHQGGNISHLIVAEEHDWELSRNEALSFLIELLGNKVVLLSNERFRQLAKELPFIARNHLENGKSENLWYEEVVPRESLFYTFIQSPNSILLAHEARKRDT